MNASTLSRRLAVYDKSPLAHCVEENSDTVLFRADVDLANVFLAVGVDRLVEFHLVLFVTDNRVSAKEAHQIFLVCHCHGRHLECAH